MYIYIYIYNIIYMRNKLSLDAFSHPGAGHALYQHNRMRNGFQHDICLYLRCGTEFVFLH